MQVLVVIPARGGSKGIPRKNLCPIGGKPLLAWTVEAAKAARSVSRVLVSSDDDEILTVAERFGAMPVARASELAKDAVTLDPVIFDAVQQEEAAGRNYDLVLTVQPTSPLLRASTIDRIVARLADEPVDTILTAVDDTHLSWTDTGDGPRPAYQARVNRQQLPPRYRETGGVLATRARFVKPGGRIGPRVALEVLRGFEGLDIDTRDDWLTAEAALGRRRIAFVVIGNRRQGLGHVTRAQTLLESFNGHEVQVFCGAEQDLAIDRFRARFHEPIVRPREELTRAVLDWLPDVVVHDELNTQPDELRQEREAGCKVVVFEDNGPGREQADVVFNALFDEERSDPQRNWFFGPDVYCLRDEFRHADRGTSETGRFLVTFGGTDPAHLTQRVLSALAPLTPRPCTVVAGRGLDYLPELRDQVAALRDSGWELDLLEDVRLMSEQMAAADFAFTSAGRTLYELAHMGVPGIVLAQNEVEMSHTFGAIENGFVHLGRGHEVDDGAIAAAYRAVAGSAHLRQQLRNRMLLRDLSSGLARVVGKILEISQT